MRKLILIKSLAVMMIAGVTACESLVTDIPEAKLPKAESRLVVNSIISPQLQYITVIVSESVPLFSKSEAKETRLGNATVKISDGVKEVAIPYDAENNLYSLDQSKFPIVASKTYTLSVTEGKRSVTAHCTVPAQAPVIKSYLFDTLIFENAYYKDTALTLRINWQDIPGDSNQYRVHAMAQLEYNVSAKTNSGDNTEDRMTYTFRFNWNWQQGKDEFQSDNHQDGAVFASPLGKLNLPRVREEILDGKKIKVYPKTQIKTVLLEVLNIDRHYYKYHRSLEARNNEGNPFSEPSNIYSNVAGGFGCFAAYNAAQIWLTKLP